MRAALILLLLAGACVDAGDRDQGGKKAKPKPKPRHEVKLKAARLELAHLVAAFDKWATLHPGECPANLGVLAPRRTGQDPWGTPYVVHCGDTAPPGLRFGLVSAGPDKKPGTKDDLKSWK